MSISEEILQYIVNPQMVQRVVESNTELTVVLQVNVSNNATAVYEFTNIITTEYMTHTGYVQFIVLYDNWAPTPMIHMYRNGYLLNGEACIFDVNIIRWKLIDLLNVRSVRNDVTPADTDAILNACGRKPYWPNVTALRRAVCSSTYNGHIDSYRQPSKERRVVGEQLVPLCTPLHFAVRAQWQLPNEEANIAIIEELVLTHNADINASNENGETILHHALMWRRPKIMIALVEWGCRIEFITKESMLETFGFIIKHTEHHHDSVRYLLQLLAVLKYRREQYADYLQHSVLGGDQLVVFTILRFVTRKPLSEAERMQIELLPPSIVADHRALLY